MDKLEGETGTAAVLVVEDEALFRDSVCTALSRSGYAVRSAATVQDAVQALAASVPDVLVLDVSLPDGSAEDVLEELRRRQGSTKVLVVTGTYDGDRWANLEDDVELIVPKPISINTVRKMVGRLLQPLPRTTERFARRFSFSPRETQMLQLATEGLNDKEVAAELGCSRGTLATYWQRIFKKTGQRSQRDVLAAMVRYLSSTENPTVTPDGDD